MLIYVIVAGCWIAFTDRFLEWLVEDPNLLTDLQTVKGIFYVLATGGGLYYLIRKSQTRLTAKQAELNTTVQDLQSEKELKDILFDRIPVLISIYDPDLKEFEVNKEFEKVLGWSNEEIEQKDIDLLEECYPDFETREEVVNFMNSPGVGWKEFPMTKKSGERMHTSWTNVKLTDDTSVGIGIDMTEIKATEAKIRESRNLLERTFESLKSSLILVDPQTRTIVDCNESTEEIFGYSKDELIGQSTRKLHVNDEKFELFNQIGAASLAEKGVFQTEFQMQTKDGTILDTDHTVSYVFDEDGDVDKVVSVVRDITARKEYERQLKKRQERLLRSQQIGQLGDWEFDPHTGTIHWSEMMYKIFERDPQLGPPSYEQISSLYYGADTEKHNRAVEQALEENKPYDIDLQLITDKKNKKYIRAIGIPIQNDAGDLEKLLGVIQDITDRKETEIALQKSEQRLQAITDNVPGVVFQYELKPDGREALHYVSEGAQDIWGLSAQEIKKNASLIWEHFPEEELEKVKRSIERSAQNLSSWNTEWEYQHPKGKTVWHHGIGIPHKQKDDSIIWDSIIIDITEQKRLQEQVLKSAIEGEDRERKRIARELHDGLGQYLVAANMNFESIKQEIQELPEKRQSQFQTGLSLLKNALSETRSIAYNLMPKAIEDYGLITALENLIQDYEKSTDIEFSFIHNCEELDLQKQAAINIYRIVQEIVSNAVQHAECSTIILQLQLTDDKLTLIAKDDGIGMDLKDQRDRSGLGIKSIEHRASNLKGRLNFTSRTGKGVRVSLAIPNIQRLYSKTES